MLISGIRELVLGEREGGQSVIRDGSSTVEPLNLDTNGTEESKEVSLFQGLQATALRGKNMSLVEKCPHWGVFKVPLHCSIQSLYIYIHTHVPA